MLVGLLSFLLGGVFALYVSGTLALLWGKLFLSAQTCCRRTELQSPAMFCGPPPPRAQAFAAHLKSQQSQKFPGRHEWEVDRPIEWLILGLDLIVRAQR